MTNLSNFKYRPDIDGLRTLAVLPVILFHAGFKSFGGGFVGVDIFFVISGYLITTIIVSELDRGEFSIIGFYERRARRILPALFFVMLFCLPVAWFFLIPFDLKSFSQSLIAVSLFGSNFFFWKTSGYFDTATDLKPLLHTWSLSVEEQYYMIFPLLLMFAWGCGRRRIASAIGFVAILSLVFAQYFSFYKPMVAFYLLPTRAWELMVGAIVAFYHAEHNINKHKHAYAQILSFLGLFGICYSVFFYDKKIPFPGFYALLPTIGAALVIAFSTKNTLAGKILGSKPFVGIGLISYSAYLWHQPLFAFIRYYLESPPDALVMIAATLLSILFAYFTWLFVERPFRNKQRFSRKLIFLFSLTGSIFFIIIGMVGSWSNGGFNYKTNEAQRELLRSAKKSPMRSLCHSGGSSYRIPAQACEYFEGDVKVATFGDSHTVELAYALADELREKKVKVKHYSFSGCPPMFERKDAAAVPFCTEWTNAALENIIENKDIQLVVVSYRINLALYGGHEGVFPSLPDDFRDNPGERSERWNSYIRSLDKLIASGKKVVLVLQAPELPQPIDHLIIKSHDPEHDIPGVSADWWKRRQSFVSQHIDDLPKKVMIIDPAKYFCDGELCYATKNGVSLYFDDDHMSVEGARIVAKQVIGISGFND